MFPLPVLEAGPDPKGSWIFVAIRLIGYIQFFPD
jgi:hypothetical protein